jgi:hypothetical protein
MIAQTFSLEAETHAIRVFLNKVSMPRKTKRNIASHIAELLGQAAPTDTDAASVLPPHVLLNMNKTPVLDQGRHGTCATFATTAVIDALYGKGDYISQLCTLELGNYLATQKRNYPSGWNGSTPLIVIKQIEKYGIQSKKMQQTIGCAGVREYPLNEMLNTGQPMSIDDFNLHSEKILSTLSWKSLYKPKGLFVRPKDMDKIIEIAKTALFNGHRIILSMLIDAEHGGVGTFGSYQAHHDSWILTPLIADDAQHELINAGHALVMIGYDDHAVIYDDKQIPHNGIFILRNSWGEKAGYHGDYYMSYDYFKALAINMIEIYG